jgi:GNAT superfamily N-acetyltransferase
MRALIPVLNPPGVPTMIIQGISILPAYQRKGVGSAFYKVGTDMADKAQCKIWTHASEAGYPPLLKHGYEIFDTLTVDLDKYADRPFIDDEGKEQPWGTYTFRYMQRNPRPVES